MEKVKKIEIKIPIQNDYQTVFAGFNRELFLALAPKFPPSKLLRFDGSQKGDEVHIELGFFPFKELWVSVITEEYWGNDEIYFIDEGIKLPMALQYWRHKHRIIPTGEKTCMIIEDISYQAVQWLPAQMVHSILYRIFAYRIPIYQKIFNLK